MSNKKDKKELNNSTLANVKKEMAKPRIVKSARLGVRRDLDITRISEQLTNGSTLIPSDWCGARKFRRWDCFR
jgi:hypothetical protein